MRVAQSGQVLDYLLVFTYRQMCLQCHNSGHVLRNTPPDVLHFQSSTCKIYHLLKHTLNYCSIQNIIIVNDFCT